MPLRGHGFGFWARFGIPSSEVVAMSIGRRALLGRAAAAAAGSAAAAVVPIAPYLQPLQSWAGEQPEGIAEPPPFESVERLYRDRWRGEKGVKVPHTGGKWMRGWSWDACVRDGIVWREEQNRIYEASGPGVPDFNPRGCQ